MTKGTCTVEGCEKAANASRGWCWGHYERWLNHGNPLAGRPPYTDKHSERFWSKTETIGDCILWRGTLKPNGYGVFNVGTKRSYAHRWAYQDKIGPIPDGLDLDHLCRNRACVNPEHLEPVTRKVNLNRGINAEAAKTHCPQGHPYDEANTKRWGHGRTCHACSKARSTERQRRERRAAGVPLSNHVSAEERALIGELYRSGMTQRAIAEKLGRAVATIHRALKALGEI